jgi:natural product biosynthesis luciferase-like monooxygenase protein
MSIRSIVDSLIELDIHLSIEEGELKVRGSKENLTQDVVEKIKVNKQALIGLLSTKKFNNASDPMKVNRSSLTSSKEPIIEPAKHLDFGIFYFGNADVEKEKYKLLINGAKHADKNGYTCVWTPERHFHEFGGLYPSPSVLGSALAMITEKISIRAGSVVVPLHNELRVAEEWSVIDNLSNGRVGIACASGWQPNDFVLAPDIYSNRHEIMYEKIEKIRRLWRGEYILLKDGNGFAKETRIFPKPIQNELPIWITSRGHVETFKSAGRLGLNVITHLLGETIEELFVKIKEYRNEYKKHFPEKEPGKVVLMLHTFIGENLEDTYSKARAPFINYLRTALGLIRNLALSRGYDIDAENFSAKDLDGMLDYAFDRYASESSLIGTKQNRIHLLQAISRIGVDEIACLIDFGIGYSATMRGLELLTELKDEYNLEVDKNRKRELWPLHQQE